MTDERRFGGYLVGWTLLTTVAVTAVGVAAESPGPLGFTHSYLVAGRSGPAARLAAFLPKAFALAVAGVLVLVPVVVAAVRLRRGTDPVATGGLLLAALAVYPGLPFALSWFFMPPLDTGIDTVVGIGTLAVVGVMVAVHRAGVPSRPAFAGQFPHVGLVVVVFIGAIAGGAVGLAAQGTLVESDRAFAPQASFEATYTVTDEGRGVVTITHSGGEPVSVDQLSLGGDGFADVSGATQTAPGPWQGSANGDGETVVPGDSVTVGVVGDCTVRLVYTIPTGGLSETIDVVHCEELR